MKNKCKKCGALIKKGETYCTNCQDKMAQDAPIEYLKAMMRGDTFTANRIKEDNANFEVTSMVISDSNGGTYRVCSKCGYKNKGSHKFFETYHCEKCGNEI